MANPTSADVIVVGAGNAALIAALSAHETGARVIVLEKAPKELRGGNSYFTGGGFNFAYRPEDAIELLADASQAEREGIEWEAYTADQYYNDLMRITEVCVNSELAELVALESLPTVKWMKAQGIRWETHHQVDVSALRNGKIHVGKGNAWYRVQGGGVGLVNALFELLERRNIGVMYGTKAVKLLLNQQGQVCGVTAKDKDGFRDIQGRAVILACGSYEANREMRLRYLGPDWEMVPIRGSRFNTGDGLRMALEIGAQAAGHWGGCHAAQVDLDAPDIADPAETDNTTRSGYQMGVIVNVAGKRFVDEGEDLRPYTYTKFAHEVLRQPQRMAVQIMDAKMFPHLSSRYTKGRYLWADSIGELAEKLDINVASLVKTVNEFNAAVQPGIWDLTAKDGKQAIGVFPPKSNWAIELDTPPFYAFPTKAAITFAYGGLKINRRGQVMDNEDEIIPGLYAAGEMVGFWHYRYMGGSGLMVGAVTGRIAGRESGGE